MIPEIFKTPKKLFRLTEKKKVVGNNDEQQQELNTLTFEQHLAHDRAEEDQDDENRYFFVLPAFEVLKRKTNRTADDLETLTAVDASSGSCLCHPKLAAKGRFLDHCPYQKSYNVLKFKKVVQFEGKDLVLILFKAYR